MRPTIRLALNTDRLPKSKPTDKKLTKSRTLGGDVIVRNRCFYVRSGPSERQLSNFEIQIVEEIVRTGNGVEERMFVLEGHLQGGTPLPAKQIRPEDFQAMNWPLKLYGPELIIGLDRNDAKLVRVAIQKRSTARKVTHRRTQNGWFRHDGHTVYAHAAGAIGPMGVDTSLTTDLPGRFGLYRLRMPDSIEDEREAFHEFLSILDGAPPRLTVPLLAAVPRSILGGGHFTIHLEGDTARRKSVKSSVRRDYLLRSGRASTIRADTEVCRRNSRCTPDPSLDHPQNFNPRTGATRTE